MARVLKFPVPTATTIVDTFDGPVEVQRPLFELSNDELLSLATPEAAKELLRRLSDRA